jgi:hypothetical protein
MPDITPGQLDEWERLAGEAKRLLTQVGNYDVRFAHKGPTAMRALVAEVRRLNEELIAETVRAEKADHRREKTEAELAAYITAADATVWHFEDVAAAATRTVRALWESRRRWQERAASWEASDTASYDLAGPFKARAVKAEAENATLREQLRLANIDACNETARAQAAEATLAKVRELRDWWRGLATEGTVEPHILRDYALLANRLDQALGEQG